MARRTLLLLASILVAALGTALIWLYVQGADARAEQGQTLVTAYFLNRKLEAGARPEQALAAATAKRVPTDVAADALTSPQQAPGLVLADAAAPGQILLRSMFSTNTSVAVPGRGILTISVTDPHRVPAQLKPGDQVAVYELGNVRAAKPLTLVQPKITVVSIGSTMQTPTGSGSPVPVTIVGFDANPAQAVSLASIEATGGQAQLYLLGPGTQGAGT
jgi:pilus assembly protein CpaB